MFAPNSYADAFGSSVSLNYIGNTIIVGAPFYDSLAFNNGGAFVFDWNGMGWIKRGRALVGDASDDKFGISTDIDSLGNQIIIGTPVNDFNGNRSGIAKVFQWIGNSWVQKGNSLYGDSILNDFGASVSMSADGNIIAVGAPNYSKVTNYRGMVRVFQWQNNTWSQMGQDILGDTTIEEEGYSIGLSNDGKTLVTGAKGAYRTSSNSDGRIKVFKWNGNSWQQKGANLNGRGGSRGFSCAIDKTGNIGVGFSPSSGLIEGDVVFFADLLDEHLTTPSIQEKKVTIPSGSGSTTGSSYAEYLNKNEMPLKGFEFLKQELRGSAFYVMNQKSTNSNSTIGTNLYLKMTKTEYDGLSTSGLDTNVQEPMIKFNGINDTTDLDAVPYRRAPVEVNGLDSSGNSIKVNGGFDVVTFNYDTLSTETKSNTANVSEQGNGILTIDEFIDALKVVEKIYHTDNLLETCTRIRVHYYGHRRDIPANYFYDDFGKGAIFNRSIPLAPYPEYYDWEEKTNSIFPLPRHLHSSVFERFGKGNTYNKLTNNANENGTRDNPSPYLDAGFFKIDVGQILYGFESIYYQPHEPVSDLLGTSMPPDITYSQGYEGYPIRIVNDLAGWLANVATAPVELFVHLLNGGGLNDSPLGDDYKGPNPPTLQYYYEASNPQADIFGNADSIGIYRAYQVLNENPTNTDLKLSDAFTLYYKGAGALRSGISLLATPTFNRYTSTDRWKIFSLFYGFLEEPTPGNFNWVPDDATKFSNLKAPYNSTTNPTGKDYDNRLYNFAKFWYSRREDFDRTAFNLLFKGNYFDSLNFLTSGTFSNSIKSESQWVKDELDDAFEVHFLTDLKSLTI